jgi:hypothetical protein
VSLLIAILIGPGEGLVLAQPKTETTPAVADAAGAQQSVKVPAEQLESLVAPIALYPDPLLAQTLVAATYPLELVQLHQWLAKHPNLKDKALADSVATQPWDPSIQSMAALPDVVKRLADDIQWTTDLGNAFLAQQGDVMDAVQRLRQKAKDKGALESNEHQKVETKVVEEKTIIVVEPADPEVIYVPSYSPVVVWGPPLYPYPPIYYPYYPPGAAFVSFGFGVMWGAAWGGACCGCGWGYNNININVNNNFNRIDHHGNRGNLGDRGNRGDRGNLGDRGGNRPGGAGGGTWTHNPEHRGGAPYGDRATANQYGGRARGDARPSAGQQPGGLGGTGKRGGSPGVSDRMAGAGNRGGVSDRAGAGAGVSDRSAAAGGRGGDKIGNRSIPQQSGSRSSFSGESRGYSGSSARSNSSRGSSSWGSRGSSMGGGRGGGGRGGGGRGGRR